MKDKVKILGIEINNINSKQAAWTAESFLRSNKFHFITTPNPEILLKAEKDEEYLKLLNKSDLKIPDGAGLKFGSWMLDKGLRQRVTGVDFAKQLLSLGEQKSYSVYFLTSDKSLSSIEEIKRSVFKKYPRIRIEGKEVDLAKLNEVDLTFYINQFKTDILLVAFGAPIQEKWIYKNKFKLNHVKIAIGIGGTLDFISGKIKRAPSFLRKVGLEWLYRLFQEPRYRFRRILNAVVIFPFMVLKWKLRMKFIFKKNVAAFISNNEGKVLVAHRINLNHWQIPQGGVNKDEDLESAVIREIGEELDIAPNKLEIIKGPIENFHEYVWPYFHKLHKGYKGQRQNLFFLKFLGQNKDINPSAGDELDDFKWVEVEKVVENVAPVRREMTKLALDYYNKLNIKKYV